VHAGSSVWVKRRDAAVFGKSDVAVTAASAVKRRKKENEAKSSAESMAV
jgi:hypothetical protein